MNFTIVAPEGTTNHGNPKLLCTPTQWSDVILFFFGNYFAHAATVITKPGQSLTHAGRTILWALVLPGSGINQAVNAILRRAVWETKNPLKRAARAGALCMVVRKEEADSASAGHDDPASRAEEGQAQDKVAHQNQDEISAGAAANEGRDQRDAKSASARTHEV